MNGNIIKFFRITLGTAVPAILLYASELPGVVAVPVVAFIAGFLSVTWRKFNPLEGTSQLQRFLRVSLIVGVPQALAMGFGGDAPIAIVAAILSSSLEVAYRDVFPEDPAVK